VRAVAGGHLALTAIDGGRVRNNAASIIAGDPPAGPVQAITRTAQRNDDQRIATHCNKPPTPTSTESDRRDST
jgi:hypothetical protein